MLQSTHYWVGMLFTTLALSCSSSDAGAGTSTGGNTGVGGSSGGAGGASTTGGTNTTSTAGHTSANTGGMSGTNGGATSADCSPSDGQTSCSAPIACGAFVSQVTTSSFPAAQGGSIVDGTYELTQLLSTNGTAALSLRATKIISQGKVTSTVVDQSGNPPQMSSGNYAVSGTALTWNTTCPTSNTQTYTYTVSGSQLILYQTSGGTSLATVYTRREP